MISRQNLLDATKAIEEDDKMEMIIVRDHLSQAIHKLEIDLQTVLAILGDLEHVSIEWTLSFREDGKKNIKEFKHTFQMLEDKINRQSASVQSKQTPPMGAGTASLRQQMPILTKKPEKDQTVHWMDQLSQVQSQHIKSTTRRKLFSDNQTEASNRATSAEPSNYISKDALPLFNNNHHCRRYHDHDWHIQRIGSR